MVTLRMVPLRGEAASTTGVGTATLAEQYGWGSFVSSGTGTGGRGAVVFGNPFPNTLINYSRVMELKANLTIPAGDANAAIYFQLGGSGVGPQPLVAADKGFGIRSNGTSTTSIVCFVSNGTTLAESSPITLPNSADLLSGKNFRIASNGAGSVKFYYSVGGSGSTAAAWSELTTMSGGPTGTGTTQYGAVAFISKASGSVTTNTVAYARNVWFYLE
jgi:hypothetical protein